MILRSRLFAKLLLTYVVLLLSVLLVVDFSMAHHLRALYIAKEENRLVTTARTLAVILPQELEKEAQFWAVRFGEQTGFRITLVGLDGKVLADNRFDPIKMDDHSNRPEIRQARQEGSGRSIRFSRTLGKNELYMAQRVDRRDGSPIFLRLAMPLEEVSEGFQVAQRELFEISIFPFLLAVALGYMLTRSLVRRIYSIQEFSRNLARGNLSARIREITTDEIGSLAQSLNDTADQMHHYIDELQDEQNRIRAILESMQAGVLATDKEGRVTLINKFLAGILRIDGAKSLGSRVLEVVRDVELKKIFDRVLEEKTELTATVEMRLDSPRVFEVVAVPLREVSSLPGGVVAVLHDITKLQRLENVRKDFVANVSHELRTPLTSIRGFAETLLDGALEDKKNNRRFVEIIKSHAIRLSDLTTDLLTLATLDSSDSVVLKRESVDLKGLLEEVLETVRPLAMGRKHKIESHLAESLPCLTGDRDRLRQVFLNLLDNAIKFTGESGKISLEANLGSDGRAVEIHIRDTGTGIPSSDLPRIFERFYRVDKARSRELGGTGLGLAIVKHIVEAHKGKVDVKSTLGQGSDFCVTLPLKESR